MRARIREMISDRSSSLSALSAVFMADFLKEPKGLVGAFQPWHRPDAASQVAGICLIGERRDLPDQRRQVEVGFPHGPSGENVGKGTEILQFVHGQVADGAVLRGHV